MIRDKAIGAWQTGILIFFLLFANKILILPSLLFNNAKFEGLITPIVLFILELLLLVIFYKLKKRFPHERFFDVLKNHFGKIVTCIVFFLVGIYFLGKMILLYNVTYIFSYRSVVELLWYQCLNFTYITIFFLNMFHVFFLAAVSLNFDVSSI